MSTHGAERMSAAQILREAANVIEERALLRDSPSGERSMAPTVSAFNALHLSADKTELDGWKFMCCLKLARASQGEFHLDDWIDLAGYAALAGECGQEPL